ncbi:MAG: UPF0175 family protein [Chroococcales cyanobacterium]
MSLTIPDDLLQAAQMSEEELLEEIILMLFRQKKISISKASSLLDMHLVQFQHLLASRGLYVHYGMSDLKEDIITLQQLGRL